LVTEKSNVEQVIFRSRVPLDALEKETEYYLYRVDSSVPASPLDIPPGFGPLRILAIDREEVKLAGSASLADTLEQDAFVGENRWRLSPSPTAYPSHYAEDLQKKAILPPDLFLSFDPLVGATTSLAARTWAPALTIGILILALCLFVPRAFCSYLCPMGTLIDGSDRWITGWFRLRQLHDARNLRHMKYLLLGLVLGAACFGVTLSGFLAPLPLLARTLNFLVAPLQLASIRSWQQVPPIETGQILAVSLFVVILLLGLFASRFWCRYLCPTGAILSLTSFFRLHERHVRKHCIACGRCRKTCTFDAIEEDYRTRTLDCTLCQECGGSCPVEAIQFETRWHHRTESLGSAASSPQRRGMKASRRHGSEGAGTATGSESPKPNPHPPSSRRGFLGVGLGLFGGFAGGAMLGTFFGFPRRAEGKARHPVRPPGAVPEEAFLELCTRCGACFQTCPNNVLQPMPVNSGYLNLWTPAVNADWAGCDSSCNNCGQVCPTGAIRPLPLAEKRVAHMGLAIVNEKTCLPYAGVEECRLCFEECEAAEYHAIEFMRVGTEVDPFGQPIEGTGLLAPVVLPEKCVGCGLCQSRCYSVNKKEKGLLEASAIIVEAGPGKEDRMRTGSYRALRRKEAEQRKAEKRQHIEAPEEEDDYLPDFLD
jgi:ferredoxin